MPIIYLSIMDSSNFHL